MAQVKTSKPLTYHCDTPSVRIFQEFAGESLDNLDEYEAWDIITVLSQAVSLANLNNETTIDIPNALLCLSNDLLPSEKCKKCLKALDGFPAAQVNALMIGILAVAFEEDLK
jgi:hypothetical protein